MKKREALEHAIRRGVVRWSETAFAWGVADCLLSLADIVLDARGYDPAAPFRNRYSTRIGAVRVTRAYGGFDGALEAMAWDCGWREIRPRDALVGDIGLLDGASRTVGGVIKDVNLWIGRKEHGFIALPTPRVARAWRVR